MLGAPGNISASSIEALSAEHHAICALTHPKKDLDSYGGKVTFTLETAIIQQTWLLPASRQRRIS